MFEQLFPALLFAFLTAVSVWGMLRLQVPMWGFFILPLLPVLLLLLNTDWAIYSHHGFMHSSIVYEIYERGFPPEHPLLAGQPLFYPFMHHALIALALKILPLAPPWLFALTNLLSLAIFVWALDRIAFLISQDRVFRVLTVLLALLGPSLFTYRPFSAIPAALDASTETRLIPLHKFTTISSNPLGLMFFTLLLLGVMYLSTEAARPRRGLGLLTLGLLGCGFFYPIVWPAALACALAAGVYLMMHHRLPPRFAIWAIDPGRSGSSPGASTLWGGAAVTTAVFGSLLLVPFLLMLKNEGASGLVFLPSRLHLLRNAVIIGYVLLLPALLVWFGRQRCREAFRKNPVLFAVLLICSSVTLGLYTTVSLPAHSEYKFLALGLICLSPLVALALADLFQRKRMIALMVIFVVGLPFGAYFGERAGGWPVIEPVRTRGQLLVAERPAERELYLWIGRNSPRDAVFLDDSLNIPVLGRRPLFVALDQPSDRASSKNSNPRRKRDGWSMPASVVLEEVTSVNRQVLEQRRRLAETLLSGEPAVDPESVMGELSRMIQPHPLFVVARSRVQAQRLDRSPHTKLVFRGREAQVFQLFLPPVPSGAMQAGGR